MSTCECGLNVRDCDHGHVTVSNKTGTWIMHEDREATPEEAQLIIDSNQSDAADYRPGMTCGQVDAL